VDTRSERLDPAAGWYLGVELEQALSSTLERVGTVPVAVPLPPGGSPPGAAEAFGRFTRLRVDLRRYNRISPTSRLNLRLTGGGALTERGLPPQRQHALGGEGTLPGFPLLRLDCGARALVVERADRPAGGPRYYPAYGCDRFALGQVEYRSDLPVRLPAERLGGIVGPDAVASWVAFVDAAAGWSRGDPLPNERVALDVGVGLLWGRIGLYGAVPFGARSGEGGANLFVRLVPRF
jgi:hypothetical protein